MFHIAGSVSITSPISRSVVCPLLFFADVLLFPALLSGCLLAVISLFWQRQIWPFVV
jgi:hypothetical protein